MGRKIKRLKNILSKVFTLSYPKWRFLIFLVILIFLRFLPFSIIEKTPRFSICSMVLGKYCYSIGITRGVSMLLRGDFSSAIEYNLLCIPVLGILIGFILHDFYKGFIKGFIKSKK
jgi:hypothetical protein